MSDRKKYDRISYERDKGKRQAAYRDANRKLIRERARLMYELKAREKRTRKHNWGKVNEIRRGIESWLEDMQRFLRHDKKLRLEAYKRLNNDYKEFHQHLKVA